MFLTHESTYSFHDTFQLQTPYSVLLIHSRAPCLEACSRLVHFPAVEVPDNDTTICPALGTRDEQLRCWAGVGGACILVPCVLHLCAFHTASHRCCLLAFSSPLHPILHPNCPWNSRSRQGSNAHFCIFANQGNDFHRLGGLNWTERESERETARFLALFGFAESAVFRRL